MMNRRFLLGAMLSGHATVPMKMPNPGNPGKPRIGDLFRIAGGDGDQRYLGVGLTLRLTQADWFSGRIDEPDYGQALLFVVEGGEKSGEYIALTTRVRSSLESQFERQGWASTVVHVLKTQQGPSYGGLAIGMAFVDRLGAMDRH